MRQAPNRRSVELRRIRPRRGGRGRARCGSYRGRRERRAAGGRRGPPRWSVVTGSPRPLVAVVDYGIGNLHSAHKSLQHEGADARLTADAGLIADAVAVVLPGVGAFGACLDALRSRHLEEPVLAAVESGRPFLGVCIGTQMLFDASEEDPGVRGLGVLAGRVRWIPP